MSFIGAVFQDVTMLVKGKKTIRTRAFIGCPAEGRNVPISRCESCNHYGGIIRSGIECGHKKAAEVAAESVHLLEECPLSKRRGRPCVGDGCPMWIDLEDFRGCALLLTKGSLQQVLADFMAEIKKVANAPDRQDKKEDTVRENP